MKRTRQSVIGFTAFALLASITATALPARADQPTYMRDIDAYKTAGTNLDARVKAVETFLGSPTGLTSWVNDVTKLARTFDGTSHSLWDMIYLDAARNNTSFCDTYKAQLDGSWGSNYGIYSLEADYGTRVGIIYEARSALEASESKLIDKVAKLAADHKPIDKLLNDQLATTRTTLSKLEPLYQSMLSRSNSLLSNILATRDAMRKPNCGQPTPKPQGANSTPTASKVVAQATPTPTPKPTQAPKPQSIPTGIDRWAGTWIDGPPTTVSCGADLNAGGADLRMRCVVTPKIGGGLNITAEGDFTLLCKLTSPTMLTSTCAVTGKWHETNYDADMAGTASLQFDYGRRGIQLHWQMKRDRPTRMPPMGSNGPKVAVLGTYYIRQLDVFLHH